jgi:hypothetical protein
VPLLKKSASDEAAGEILGFAKPDCEDSAHIHDVEIIASEAIWDWYARFGTLRMVTWIGMPA